MVLFISTNGSFYNMRDDDVDPWTSTSAPCGNGARPTPSCARCCPAFARRQPGGRAIRLRGGPAIPEQHRHHHQLQLHHQHRHHQHHQLSGRGTLSSARHHQHDQSTSPTFRRPTYIPRFVHQHHRHDDEQRSRLGTYLGSVTTNTTVTTTQFPHQQYLPGFRYHQHHVTTNSSTPAAPIGNITNKARTKDLHFNEITGYTYNLIQIQLQLISGYIYNGITGYTYSRHHRRHHQRHLHHQLHPVRRAGDRPDQRRHPAFQRTFSGHAGPGLHRGKLEHLRTTASRRAQTLQHNHTLPSAIYADAVTILSSGLDPSTTRPTSGSSQHRHDGHRQRGYFDRHRALPTEPTTAAGWRIFRASRRTGAGSISITTVRWWRCSPARSPIIPGPAPATVYNPPNAQLGL